MTCMLNPGNQLYVFLRGGGQEYATEKVRKLFWFKDAQFK